MRSQRRTTRMTRGRIFPFAAVFCILSILLLGGCYDSPVPLPETGEPADLSLLGIWEVTEGPNAGERVIVDAADRSTYLIAHINSKGDRAEYQARESVLSSEELKFAFFSVRELPVEENSSYFFAFTAPYDDTGYRLLAFVDADAVDGEFRSSDDLLLAFRKALRNKDLQELLTGGYKLQRVDATAGR